MPAESLKSRGATRNATPTRFNLKERVVEGDWLDSVESLDGVVPRRTTVTVEKPKSILTRNSSPDIGFDRSINPYRGCEHGCIYCFARPTHAYHDLSPGVDFESRLFVKPDAAKLGIASVAISVTSLDPKIHRTLEPRAPAARKRLAAIRALTDAGVPAFVAIAPVVPQITDHEMESIVAAAAEAGARGGFWLPVRLPHEVAPLFRAWLDEHYPDRASKVMATINSIRGGRDNDPNFFTRMRGQGPWAELLRSRFEKAAKRYGLPQAKFPLRRDLFEPPEGDQLRLL